jgi:hypothetical protein
MSLLAQFRCCLIRMPMVLRLWLAAYALVAMGVFSWLPSLVLQSDQTHQVYVSQQGDVVSWVLHHVGTMDQHDPLGLHEHQAAHVLDHPHDEPDHQYQVSHVDQHPVLIQLLDFKSLIFLTLIVALLQAFLALWRYVWPRHLGRLPVFLTPCQNRFAQLTRTVVLRH